MRTQRDRPVGGASPSSKSSPEGASRLSDLRTRRLMHGTAYGKCKRWRNQDLRTPACGAVPSKFRDDICAESGMSLSRTSRSGNELSAEVEKLNLPAREIPARSALCAPARYSTKT